MRAPSVNNYCKFAKVCVSFIPDLVSLDILCQIVIPCAKYCTIYLREELSVYFRISSFFIRQNTVRKTNNTTSTRKDTGLAVNKGRASINNNQNNRNNHSIPPRKLIDKQLPSTKFKIYLKTKQPKGYNVGNRNFRPNTQLRRALLIDMQLTERILVESRCNSAFEFDRVAFSLISLRIKMPSSGLYFIRLPSLQSFTESFTNTLLSNFSLLSLSSLSLSAEVVNSHNSTLYYHYRILSSQ